VKYITGECPECRRVIAAAMVLNQTDRRNDIDEFVAGGLSVQERDVAPDSVIIFDHAPGCARKRGASLSASGWRVWACGLCEREYMVRNSEQPRCQVCDADPAGKDGGK
jgi:hypothetical protein